MGRRWRFLKEVYEVKKGGDRGNQYTGAKTDNVGILKTKDELASEFGKSTDALDYAERIQDLPEPIRDAVREKKITASVLIDFKPFTARAAFCMPPRRKGRFHFAQWSRETQYTILFLSFLYTLILRL